MAPPTIRQPSMVGFAHQTIAPGGIFPYVRSINLEDAVITNAKIANATIEDAKIKSLSADKITAGTISVAVDLFETNITLDGTTGLITVNDGSVDRVKIGRISAGTYGIEIRNAAGDLMWSLTDGAQTPGIADDAVTTPKIPNLAVTNAKINDLVADKITTGNLVATVSITSGLIRTAASGQRVELDTSGIRGIDASGVTLFQLATSGSPIFLLRSAASGARIEYSSAGHFKVFRSDDTVVMTLDSGGLIIDSQSGATPETRGSLRWYRVGAGDGLTASSGLIGIAYSATIGTDFIHQVRDNAGTVEDPRIFLQTQVRGDDHIGSFLGLGLKDLTLWFDGNVDAFVVNESGELTLQDGSGNQRLRVDNDLLRYRQGAQEILFVDSGRILLRASDASERFDVSDAALNDRDTVLRLRYDIGGTSGVQRVTAGAADSGGTGFRVLRVPNNAA